MKNRYGRIVNMSSQASVVGIPQEAVDDPAFSKPLLAQIPVGRVGTVTDVAAAVLFYASPAACDSCPEVIHWQ